jgi:predicted TIM-barrel fold metal-dependent hydrolase
MIVDMHVHLYDDGWIPKPFLLGLGRIVAANMARPTGEFPDPEPIIGVAVEQLKDPNGDQLIADMDGAGVDASVVFPVDYALATDEPCSGTPDCVPIAEQNRIFGEIAKNHGKRLVHLAAVDPRRKDAAAILEKSVTEQGARGLKLHPTAGFYPDDPVCFPLYAKAQELGVTVLFHTGTQPAPMKAKYSRPIFVDGVAAEFPDLKIVMAHVGHCWWEEALALAGTKWNLYVDFSGWQRVYLHSPDDVYLMLRRALDEIGPWRVMYGTDNPYLNLMLPSKEWIAGVQAAVESKRFSFSQEEIDIIMGAAAAKLFGIEA